MSEGEQEGLGGVASEREDPEVSCWEALVVPSQLWNLSAACASDAY